MRVEKRLLVVSPHFPPTDTVDMHRVRMNVRHYRCSGWEPSVLCVHQEDTGRLIDDKLVETLPEELSVSSVRAEDSRFARSFGVSAIGLRAYRALAQAGDALLAGRRFDLVFFSTTAFPVMALGARWRRQFGVPYVLDFQDPWFTLPPSAAKFRRRGAKHAVMRLIHRQLERIAVPNAAGLISVNAAHIDALTDAYPEVLRMPSAVVAFASSPEDLAVARRLGQPWAQLASSHSAGRLACLAAGRIAPSQRGIVSKAFALFKAAVELGDPSLCRLDLAFLGTGYQAMSNPYEVLPLAREVGLTDRVFEAPDRLPLLDALASLDRADVLIVVGSEDTAYQPSKLHQYVDFGKPVLVFANRTSTLAHAVRDMENVVMVPVDSPPDAALVNEVAARLKIVRQSCIDSVERVGRRRALQAADAARAEAALFDEAVAFATAGYIAA